MQLRPIKNHHDSSCEGFSKYFGLTSNIFAGFTLRGRREALLRGVALSFLLYFVYWFSLRLSYRGVFGMFRFLHRWEFMTDSEVCRNFQTWILFREFLLKFYLR